MERRGGPHVFSPSRQDPLSISIVMFPYFWMIWADSGHWREGLASMLGKCSLHLIHAASREAMTCPCRGFASCRDAGPSGVVATGKT